MPFTEHPVFQAPDRETTIWRYMGLAKFLSLLDKSSSFFASIDTLARDDPFEGRYTNASIKAFREMTVANFKQRYGAFREVSDEVVANLLEMQRKIPNTMRPLRHAIFVNSWYMHSYESAAMWSLYLKSQEGIAIKSTFGHLVDSFEEEELNIYAGRIRYIDYHQEHIPEGNIFYPFVFKRRSFEHENELRALVGRLDLPGVLGVGGTPEEPLSGIYIRVKVDRLIERVYVAPTAPTWVRELVHNLVRRYSLDKEIVQSDLAVGPIY
jgi:hypothetical protein